VSRRLFGCEDEDDGAVVASTGDVDGAVRGCARVFASPCACE
jgi:hypothetical protein